MAEISAQMVNELRAKTGAGLMDCKKALITVGGDVAKAIEELRKSGIAKAEKKSSRSAKEGIIISIVKEDVAAQLELLCETDFVAKNDKFRAYAQECAEKLLGMDGDGDMSVKLAESEKECLLSMVATIGENMVIRRAVRWKGFCGAYIHMGGKIGVMIEVADKASVPATKDMCMHVTAFKPQYLNPSDIPLSIIEKEKEIAAALLKGKPAAMLEKILPGKLEKWYTEVCLTRQPWIRDNAVSFEKANPGVTIKRFIRWEVGEEV